MGSDATSPLTWTHTWPEGGSDFIAVLAGGTFARIHKQAGSRHSGGEWAWSLLYPAVIGLTKQGHAASKAEAVEAVRQGLETVLRWHAERRQPLVLWWRSTEEELRADPTLSTLTVRLVVGRDVQGSHRANKSLC